MGESAPEREGIFEKASDRLGPEKSAGKKEKEQEPETVGADCKNDRHVGTNGGMRRRLPTEWGGQQCLAHLKVPEPGAVGVDGRIDEECPLEEKGFCQIGVEEAKQDPCGEKIDEKGGFAAVRR